MRVFGERGAGDQGPLATTCVRLLVAAVCLAAVGCADAPKQGALREEIPVGAYSLEVVRATPAPNPRPPISIFRTNPGNKAIVVFVSWGRLDGLDTLRRIVFVESFLKDRVELMDADGRRTPAFSAMQRDLMYMRDPGPNWRDWIVVFHVPDGSRGFTVLVENPEPRDNQARVTAIPVDL